MIVHDKKYIFIHIPKCAGTSLYGALLPDYEEDDDINLTVYGGWDEQHKLYKQHATAQQTKEFYCSNFEEYFSFSFVRNPWDRVISDYLWMTTIDYPLRNGTLLEYINNENQFSVESLSAPSGFMYRYDHVVLQANYLYDDDGNQLVNYIGKFETIQKDFDEICDFIGISRRRLPHKNKSDHLHYTEYYNDETRSAVAEKYKKDIELFGYTFGD